MQFIECVLGAETDSIPLYPLYSLYIIFLYLNIFCGGGVYLHWLVFPFIIFGLLGGKKITRDKKITSVLNLQKKKSSL